MTWIDFIRNCWISSVRGTPRRMRNRDGDRVSEWSSVPAENTECKLCSTLAEMDRQLRCTHFSLTIWIYKCFHGWIWRFVVFTPYSNYSYMRACILAMDDARLKLTSSTARSENMLSTKPERNAFSEQRWWPYVLALCVCTTHTLRIVVLFRMFVPYVWGASLSLSISISFPPPQRF